MGGKKLQREKSRNCSMVVSPWRKYSGEGSRAFLASIKTADGRARKFLAKEISNTLRSPSSRASLPPPGCVFPPVTPYYPLPVSLFFPLSDTSIPVSEGGSSRNSKLYYVPRVISRFATADHCAQHLNSSLVPQHEILSSERKLEALERARIIK